MHAQPTILIADKDPDGLASSINAIRLEFMCDFLTALNDNELELLMKNKTIHILILDLDFSDKHEGLSLLDSVKNNYPETAILPIIPAGRPQLIKKMLDRDLFFHIHKPIDLLETAIALKRVHESHVRLTEPPDTSVQLTQPAFHNMIGTCEIMHRLFQLIIKVAEDDFSTVLIRGDSGTGKEMVAKAIHARSKRTKENFVAVNCAAIPDELLESELFGYTKGAFTGATSNKPGRIQYADKGTLFLDEIGDMKSSLQAKLLRVLQEKEFEPVGAFKPIPVDTRILAATHCDLEQLVSDGTFREDLYYRLSVIPLNIPPLRERPEDIIPLINLFTDTYAVKRGREKFTFSSRALSVLTCYGWRGNVRELENLIQHMSILYSGKTIQIHDLPEKFHSVTVPENYSIPQNKPTTDTEPDERGQALYPSADMPWEKGAIDFKELINDFETQLIVQAMKFTEGNKKEAARLLKLKRTTLLEKIKKKNISKLWEK
ncbi:MAG: sigma-54-dependent Fis family transcriptional regulator [Deltaproteobacteria bacterium]|nr:sigma-54-dependent Fis family transcriptional regulator [Deltaproteobacteria bacterium]